MKISVLDGSNYFKGLLLLIGKDQKVTKGEHSLLKRVGKSLGFEKEFCENAIREILDNRFIADTPPEFTTKDLAMKFVRDGLTLAMSDKSVHTREEEWLRMTAARNGLDMDWFHQESRRVYSQQPARLEVDDLTVEY